MVAVSVIIPLYNKAAFVRRTLDSIRAQTFPDFEVIVVDDGSTDDGAAVVAGYPDPRVRLVRQDNAGPGHARNRGLEEAAAPYVAFLDADDEWLPPFLERSLTLLERYGPEVATVSSGYVLDPSGGPQDALWRRRGLRDGVYRLDPDMAPQFVVHLNTYLSPWNTVARREVVRKWGGFCRRGKCLYGEDSYLWLKVLLNEAVAINLEPLVRYHTEASALARNLRGPRPVEPVLLYPEDLEAVCPPALAGLLKRVLALRAMKTACMLGYWGRWREARDLLKRFCPGVVRPLTRFAVAQALANPVGAGLGSVWRLVQGA